MFILHTQTGKYKIELRAAYSYIRSEKRYLKMIEKGIDRYEADPDTKEYGKALRKKFEAGKILEISSIFGLISKKTKLE